MRKVKPLTEAELAVVDRERLVAEIIRLQGVVAAVRREQERLQAELDGALKAVDWHGVPGFPRYRGVVTAAGGTTTNGESGCG